MHMAFVAWSVRRDNRAAAEAFRDPDHLDGIFRYDSPAARRARVLRWSALAAVLLIGSAAFVHLRNGSDALLHVIPAIPSVSLSAPVVDVPADPATPIVPGPSAGPEAPGPIALASIAAAPTVPAAPAPALFPQKGYCLIACKRDRTLYVYKRDGKTWDRTAAFPMAIGRRAGDKGDAGDLRTPEGRFWITGMLSGEAKGKMYGPLVFTLNYPRPGDAAEGKTGQGIWIHGVEAGKLPTWTHGCLSLANEDIMALSAYADVGIPVVILPDSLSPDPASQADVAGMEREFPSIMAAHMRVSSADSTAKMELLRRARDYIAREAKSFPELGMQALSPEAKQAILARLEKWRGDWMSRSIDAYSANYDPAFKDRMGRDRQSFLERKRRIFESKTKIEMEISDPRIESEGYARARISFRQEYTAEGPQGPQRSSELKSLRLEEGPAGWLIITE